MSALGSLGLSLPSPGYLLGALLFGLIGLMAYRWGKQRQHPHTRWLGLALMLYPYAITSTAMLYGVGLALCVGLYWTRP